MHVVVFTGGDFPVPEHTQLFWKNVSAPDFVIAADSGFDAALVYSKYFAGDYDFTPDLISGDMDSLKNLRRNFHLFQKKKYSGIILIRILQIQNLLLISFIKDFHLQGMMHTLKIDLLLLLKRTVFL